MAYSVGQACDLIELFAGRAGVGKDKINRELTWKLLNVKAHELARRSGVLTTKSTISSVADQQEYELPSDVIHINKVNYDDYEAHKITFDDVDRLSGNVS